MPYMTSERADASEYVPKGNKQKRRKRNLRPRGACGCLRGTSGMSLCLSVDFYGL